MSRLFALKEWFSLSDAAKRLSTSFGEEVTEADVIQLALDGHLRLSLQILNCVFARGVYKKSESEVEFREVEYRSSLRAGSSQQVWTQKEPVDGELIYLDEFCGEGEVMQSGMYPISFTRDHPDRHIVDLIVNRESRDFLLQCLQHARNHPGDPIEFDTDKLVIQEKNGQLWQIESYDDFLPENITIAVRTQALSDLEQSLEKESSGAKEKPLSTRERDTLLTLIAAMAKGGYKHDPSNRARSAVSEILEDVQKAGLSISDQTIRDKLKEAWALLPAASRKA